MSIPYQAGSDTSAAAALGVSPSVKIARRRVHDLARKAGDNGVTIDEAAVQLDMLLQTACARTVELLSNGYLKPTNSVRKTRNGYNATVVVATDKDATDIVIAIKESQVCFVRRVSECLQEGDYEGAETACAERIEMLESRLRFRGSAV